ncbi:MAG: glucosamine-6-phosphate deaminase [Phycisphaerae bacterium]|nr:glucosamine-6-phosphate deaminase [Phycisphaerae bacterium]
MRVIIVKNAEEVGKRAADLIEQEMKQHRNPVLGLATGSTPIPTYKELIRRCKKGKGMDFSTAITFNLDEYVGLPGTHDQSYRYFMNHQLFNHVNVNKKNTHVPNGMVRGMKAIQQSCDEYETMIDDVGGVDMQLLGIGGNGHIGFNEPGSSLGSMTRIKTLSLRTRKDNARFFKSMREVPRLAITMGIGTILKARKVVLLATGESKAQAVADSLEGPVSAMCPASALQLHRFATYVIDKGAASKLTLDTYEH